MAIYVYGMRLRGFSPGCQPKEGFLTRLHPVGRYYDCLAYDRLLTYEEMRDYELDYLGEDVKHNGICPNCGARMEES